MRGILLRSSANLPELVLQGNSELLTHFPFNHSGREREKKSKPKIAGWGATGA